MAYTYKYPRPAVRADCIVITQGIKPKVLLIQRGSEPFKGCWAFPGGFMNMDETTEQCAIRELEEETGRGQRLWFVLILAFVFIVTFVVIIICVGSRFPSFVFPADCHKEFAGL